MAWSDVEPEAHDLGVGTVVMIGRVLGKRTLRYIWRIQIIRRAVGCNQFPLLSSLRFQLIVSIARNLVSASQPRVTATYLPPPFTDHPHTFCSSPSQPSFFDVYPLYLFALVFVIWWTHATPPRSHIFVPHVDPTPPCVDVERKSSLASSSIPLSSLGP